MVRSSLALWIYSRGLYYVVVVRDKDTRKEISLKGFESDEAASRWRDRLQALLDEKEELD